MRNELKMYFCELLLHLILKVVPQSDNGRRLVIAINEYTLNELKITNKQK